MSLINVLLDTKTRSIKVTIDNNDVSFKSLFLDIFDGSDVSFSLEQEIPAENGLVTLKRFRLPSEPTEPVNDAGLVESEGSKIELAAKALANLYEKNKN